MNEIESLQPERLWYYFARLCKIPRPSKHEKAVVEYIENFAKQNGLDYSKDQIGNIAVRKSGSNGKENAPIIVLQSHVDMVPQKNNDKKHDFTKDPIIPVIDGEWVKADKTTLGADNGIGVAAMLAILENNNLNIGPVEALFTIDEETGMTGAFNLTDNFVKGKIMLNLDSEEDNIIFVGCAGGLDANIKFHYLEEAVPENSSCFEIIVKGLTGGHSGIDIHKERGNSIKILNRILWHATKNFGLRLSSFEGGSLRNAIPREAKAVFTIDQSTEADFKEFFNEKVKVIKKEFQQNEPTLEIILYETDQPYTLLCEDVQHNLLNAIYACPNGVMRMSPTIPEVVETSNNLAIISMKDGVITIQCLLRSSVESSKQNLSNMIDSVFTLAGADVSFEGEYPGWNPDPNSKILKIASNVFHEVNNKKTEVEVIHAGLECGIIGAKYPGMDMISFGPTIIGAHSPDEKVYIPAVEKFWKTLLRILEKVS